ncbi:MAG: bifunctional [glutamate--ammonia ligase]-adenylyl-L-tyrosine phosphorylase/[glutamate--ammonia-ligase] adenylyltransferase [Zoogloeaceae bacterium]|jgi:glutamate-ammonia-ligase adenylyltransferase|nr:bifunctional [glutamate--ammonia ligase]-adenylyl-L-tyrosine phosphorylase/[glutamate--ammonia-ligase] adenylyltransferase [Zoogloeaceae bacterium]
MDTLSDPRWGVALEHSGYLRQLCNARPELPGLLSSCLATPLSETALRAALEPPADSGETLKRQLRRLRQQAMAWIAVRDLNGLAPLSEVMENMTLLADVVTGAALEFHHRQLAEIHGEPLDATGAPQRLMVIGMGKLGGRELNVSSDVDYIFVYPEDGETAGPRKIDNFDFFCRLGKRLIAALDDITADGRVFRVDMRLRPNGDSGPLALSLNALENYFITQGREWERYAWIKARVMTPGVEDRQATWTAALEKTVRPFVFRKYLDFGAINAMRDLHAQIRREVARKDMADHIKLGPGGIREIEFIAQVFQLIRGGRDPALRIRPTRAVLERLAERGILPGETAGELLAAYDFLRRLEHRLQYAEDKQTHRLPAAEDDRARIAASMGFPSGWTTFLATLNAHREKVSAHFEAVFSDPGKGEHPLDALWRGPMEDEDAQTRLAALGFRQPAASWARLEALRQSGRYRQLPVTNRERLDTVGPRLMELARATADPDLALARGLELLETIARRGAYLALLQQYPQVLRKVVDMIADSSWAAEYLNRHPILLDELLDSRLLEAATDWPAFRDGLERQIADAAGDMEREMDVLREAHHAQVFRLLAQDLAGLHSVERLSDHLTELADIMVASTLDLCWKKIVHRHRETPAFAVIGFGKLGGKELGYASDLDLVFLYDEADADPAAQQNYTRLGQRIGTWLSARTPAGLLFETDLRLRPNGDSGVLVPSLAAFREYEREHAWIWEHQALTRARFVAGDPALGARFEAVRGEILRMARDPETLREKVLAMRQKMLDNHKNHDSGLFDVKQDRGGLIDVEFIVQYLVLLHARAHPELTANLGNISLLKRLAGLDLIPAEMAERVRDIYRDYRRLQHASRLNGVRPAVPETEWESRIETVRALWRSVFGNQEAEGTDIR